MHFFCSRRCAHSETQNCITHPCLFAPWPWESSPRGAGQRRTNLGPRPAKGWTAVDRFSGLDRARSWTPQLLTPGFRHQKMSGSGHLNLLNQRRSSKKTRLRRQWAVNRHLQRGRTHVSNLSPALLSGNFKCFSARESYLFKTHTDSQLLIHRNAFVLSILGEPGQSAGAWRTCTLSDLGPKDVYNPWFAAVRHLLSPRRAADTQRNIYRIVRIISIETQIVKCAYREP